MSAHKKQHFVPECYLKAWLDPGSPTNHTPYVWVFNKDTKTGRNKAPKNIFHQTDMYTLYDESGNRMLDIEKGLSGLEDEFSTIRKNKIKNLKDLNENDKIMLCVFASAMYVRTKAAVENLTGMLKKPLKKMKEIDSFIKEASYEDKKAIIQSLPLSHKDDEDSLSIDDLCKVLADPIRYIMLPALSALSPLLRKLDFAIVSSPNTNPGFITSDNPCVWFDPEGYKRPPLYQSPALIYDSIEITLPISPSQCLLLNRKGLNGYANIPEYAVTEINRRTRFNSKDYFVVNSNSVQESWFDPGIEPGDSWRKTQKRKR